jgi:hypothetical protein
LFAGLQFFVVLGLDPGFNPYDSPSYFNFTLNNPVRLPIVTAIYSNLKFFDFIIIFQILVSICAWIYCAKVLRSFFNDDKLKLSLSILLFSLALSSPILEQQTILMSESLSVSLIILFVAALANYLKNKKYINVAILYLFLILFAGIKISNSYLAFIITILFLLFSIIIDSKANWLSSALCSLVPLIFISFFIYIGSQANVTLKLVNTTNIIERSYDDLDLKRWYLWNDFPAISYTQYVLPQDEPPIEKVMNSPQVKKWLQIQGSDLVIKYLIEHPLFTIFAPVKPSLFIDGYTDFESIFPYLTMGTIHQNNTNLFSNLNAITMSREPDYLRALTSNRLPFWSTGKWAYNLFPSIIFFLIGVNLLMTRKLKNYSNERNLIIFLLIFTFLGIWSNWHFTVNYDMHRFLLPWSVSLRILAIFSFVSIVNQIALKKRTN